MPSENAPRKISHPGGRVRRALNWARLLDSDGLLSLTNLGVWVALGKLAFVRGASVLDLGTFVAAMLAYSVKAHRRGKEIAASEAPAVQDVGDTLARVEGIAARVTEWEGKLESLASTIKLGMTGRR